MTAHHQHLGYIMKMVVDRSETLFSQKMGPCELTAPQCRVLMFLESREGGAPVSQRDLERYLGVSHTTVKGLLQRLEEKGYVRTAFDCAEDGRVKHVYLTDKVLRQRKELRGQLDEFEELVFRGITPDERARLRELLLRVYANILPEKDL